MKWDPIERAPTFGKSYAYDFNNYMVIYIVYKVRKHHSINYGESSVLTLVGDNMDRMTNSAYRIVGTVLTKL